MRDIDYGLVNEIVVEAGSQLKTACGKDLNYTRKGRFDFVTEMDVRIQNRLMEELDRIGAGLNFICEENEKNDLAYDDAWLIDPIDGTTNFIHGYPHYCIALAHVRDREVKYAVIYNPVSKELFTAEKGKGAFLNGSRIRVSEIRQLEASIVIVGFPYDRDKGEAVFEMMKSLHKKCSDIKRRGSASLDFADVACGRAEAYFEMNLKPWDIAPGYLLVTEAGGRVRCSGDFLGSGNSFHAMASNGLTQIPELEGFLML